MALTPDELARLSPADQARYLALRQAQYGGLSFADFVLQRAPELGRTIPRHLRKLYAAIERSRRHPIRVKVSMPPGGGKSTTFRMAMVWRMLRDPACLNFYVSAGDGLAVEFSHKTRKLAREVGIPLADDRTNVHHWNTAMDGGLKATSILGDLVGRRCTGLATGDDMLRGREEAESKLQRDKKWNAFRDDFFSRLVPSAGMIVCNTRWHEDDIHGRLDKDPLGEAWEDIVIPAVTDPDGNPTDVITPDCIPYWAEMGYDLEWARKFLARGKYGFWSLGQQSPRPREGRQFEEPTRFDLREFRRDAGWRLVFALDPAATANTSSDYWAGGVLAMRGAGDDTIARPVARFRAQARIDAVIGIIRRVREKYPLPVWLEGVGGFALVPDAVRMADRSLPIRLIPSRMVRSGDKKARSMGLSVCWNDPVKRGDEARFAVPMGNEGCFDDETWDDYIDEFRDFTGLGDKHDDQVDWTSHAFNLGYRQANVGGGQSTLEVPLPE
jgi:hypothetical protein